MRITTIISILILTTFCNQKKIKEIELITNVEDLSDDIKYLSCPYVHDLAVIKIYNSRLYDTIFISIHSRENNNCFTSSVKDIHYSLIKDTLKVESISIGDNFGTPIIDTILPNDYKYYAIDLKALSYLIDSNNQLYFTQYKYPYWVGTEKELYYFKLLVGYDDNTSKLKQMDFVLPEIGEYFLLSDYTN